MQGGRTSGVISEGEGLVTLELTDTYKQTILRWLGLA